MNNLVKKTLTSALIAIMSFAAIPSFAQERTNSNDKQISQFATLKRRVAAPKPEKTIVDDRVRTDVIVVKFREGSHIRLQADQLAADPADRSESENGLLARAQIDQSKLSKELDFVGNLLQSDSGLRFGRMFKTPEETLDSHKREGEAKSKNELADLNLYYTLLIENADAARSERLIDQLNGLEIVEIAYPQPIFELAQMDIHPLTPDFAPSQGYLRAAPRGIDADHARIHPGGRGEGIRVVDVEYGWTLDHEDLTQPFFSSGGNSNDLMHKAHGTAVLGEIVGAENGYGVTGIAPQAEFGVSTTWHCFGGICWPNVAGGIQAGANQLRSGDILLIEQQSRGPKTGEYCREFNCSQFELVPVEYYQAEFDAISTATARGIVVVEAAGNGSV